jgi:hypothetical protein
MARGKRRGNRGKAAPPAAQTTAPRRPKGSPSPTPTRVCRSCGANQRAETRKCAQCGSYRHWYDGVRSATGLGVLAAIVAAVAALWPLASNWFSPRGSKLDATVAYAPLEGISILVTNEGPVAGTFIGANLFIGDGSREYFTHLRPKQGPEPSTRTILIPPNSSVLVEIEPYSGNGWMFPGTGNSCRMEYLFANNDGEGVTTRHEVACADIQGFGIILGAWWTARTRPVEADGRDPTR